MTTNMGGCCGEGVYREQTPWIFPEYETEPGTLLAGDYSLAGLTELVAIERKSLPDLCGCVTTDRECFKRALERLRGYSCKAVIIEATLEQVAKKNYNILSFYIETNEQDDKIVLLFSEGRDSINDFHAISIITLRPPQRPGASIRCVRFFCYIARD